MKYLFKAIIQDNSPEGCRVIEQTQEDKSQTNPEKNAFFDVLSNLDKVIAFALYSEDGQDEWLVDLQDLHFEHNTKQFYLHDETLTNIRLIYFKRNEILMVQGTFDQTPRTVGYFFGFQGNLPNGENRKYCIRVS